MPTITDKSQAKPLLSMKRINHGTLGCTNLAKTRRFYEEVLGLDVIQTSPVSMMVSKNADFVYACVESPTHDGNMNMLNHNGLEVETHEEVNEAHRLLMSVKDEWGLKIMPPRTVHGAHTCYFKDFDGNWWEIVSAGERGYIGDFHDKEYDMTGLHEFDGWAELYEKTKELRHVQDPETRALMKERLLAK
jgi:catechol 2,3-dioxygenase-like lactoylglutathione lyase family enzyme